LSPEPAPPRLAATAVTHAGVVLVLSLAYFAYVFGGEHDWSIAEVHVLK